MTRFFPLLGLCLGGLVLPALGTPDDRWLDTPTGWTYLFGATSTDVSNLQNGSNQRIFNIERIGSGVYDAVGVTNTGDYQLTGMQVNYNLTGATLAGLLNNNNRRLIDLETYEVGGVENHTAVTVPNTGATSAGWGYLVRVSRGEIDDWITNASPALRLVDVDVYTLNGNKQYTAVAVNNTGSQAHGWWYYYGRTVAQVTDLLTQNQARLVDIEVETPPTALSPATFTVVMIADNPGAGWWYPSVSAAQIGELLAQNGARLTCLERYTDAFGFTRYAVAMVDNANAETRRLRDAIRADIPTGDFGFMSKQVGGPVIASLNENFRFEPASMIKILHSARAMREVQTTATTLDTTTTLNTRTTFNDSCPSPATTTFPTLRTTIQRVMQDSSNEHTEALRQRYGTVGLNNFAAAWGLDGTALNHTVGCLCGELPDYNTFTARDAVSLYEQLADGSLLNEENKDELFSLMLNSVTGNSRLTTVINQEAAGTDLTTVEVAAFRSAMDAAWKGGSYNCTFQGQPRRVWRTEGAWASVPFKGSAPFYFPFDREYAMAVFVDDSSNSDAVVNQIYDYTWETIRVPIRTALLSWDAACDTDAIISQPQDTTATEGDDAQFSVSILSRPGSRDYRWQRLTNGAWASVFDGSLFAGTDTDTLTVLDVQNNDAAQYRVRINKECGQILSQPATLTVAPACDADFDNNGQLNFFDVAAFISGYNSQSAAADLAEPSGVWNFFDVNAFLSIYNAGCP